MYQWFVYSMFLNCGEDAASFLVLEGSLRFLLGFDPSAPLSWWPEEPSLVRLTCEYPTSPAACPTLVLPSSFSRLTRDPVLRGRGVSSLQGLCMTRLIRLAFAVGEPSFEVVFCPRFDMAPFEMATRKHRETHNVEQTKKLIPFVSRKLPSIRLSASWFLVTTYLIWIFGSKLILSNNQSRAPLWVLDTCLILGLLPLKIILITASLSSKCFN